MAFAMPARTFSIGDKLKLVLISVIRVVAYGERGEVELRFALGGKHWTRPLRLGWDAAATLYRQ